MPLKYNFWNSLVSVLIGWTAVNASLLFIDKSNFYIGLLTSSFLLIPNLIFVPFIIWSFDKISLPKKLFPFWSAFCVSLYLVLCNSIYGAIVSKDLSYLIINLISPLLIYIICLGFIAGLICGMIYLYIDKKFVSKPQGLTQ
ncbi:MAG: hypothetical protein SFU25_10590 [Candidatus Caenarcaniphilales bacterium]|nr:hypothetical protein [Candidatus Caenarcaniphilales bacterium]